MHQHLVGLSVCVWQPDKHDPFNYPIGQAQVAKMLLLVHSAQYSTCIARAVYYVRGPMPDYLLANRARSTY